MGNSYALWSPPRCMPWRAEVVIDLDPDGDWWWWRWTRPGGRWKEPVAGGVDERSSLWYTGANDVGSSSLYVYTSGGSAVRNQCANVGDLSSIPGWGRSSGGANGNLLQYSCLKNPTDRGAWRATVHEAVKSWTRLSESIQNVLYLALCLALHIWIHQLDSGVSCFIRSHKIKLFSILMEFSVYSHSFARFMCFRYGF